MYFNGTCSLLGFVKNVTLTCPPPPKNTHTHTHVGSRIRSISGTEHLTSKTRKSDFNKSTLKIFHVGNDFSKDVCTLRKTQTPLCGCGLGSGAGCGMRVRDTCEAIFTSARERIFGFVMKTEINL